MEEQANQSSGGMSKTLIGVVIVIVIVLAAGVYEFTKTKSETTSMTPSPTTSQMESAPTASVMEAQNGTYKDGEYTATGNYISPGGEEQVGVALTLKGGKVEDITFTPKATRPTSVKFQGQFASGYKPLVLGKSIDEVNLDEVSGSSLTPKGFNDAISQIKEQAKS
jgi:uncharacterized protein with FMN-binding domain